MKSAAVILMSLFLIATSGASAQGTAPTDPQIAHIVVTANQVDIDAGKLAESKGASKDVKDFGKQMVTDHTGVNQQAATLVKKLNVTPEDNPTSQSLKSGGAENVKKMQVLSDFKGAKFGRAYGLYLEDLGLLARCVLIIDQDDKIAYTQLVTDTSQEPDYDAVIAKARGLVTR